jgi:hypothetical protein
VLVAALLLFVQLPIPPTYAGRTIENAGHTPLFLVGTLFVLAILRHDFGLQGLRHYVWAGLIGSVAGLASEVIQQPLRRDASWEDVLADCVGVLLALGLYAFFDRRSEFRGATRAAALLIAAGCVIVYLTPVVTMARAYAHRNGQFPVLADFQWSIENAWVVGYGTRRSIHDGILDVEFEVSPFPGISFHEPVPDWSGYKTLQLEVENPDEEPLSLGVRVHDIGHGRSFADRFNRVFKLAPGERRILEVPLEDVQHAPRNRLMNMTQISDVTLFRAHSGSYHMRLYSMRLR